LAGHRAAGDGGLDGRRAGEQSIGLLFLDLLLSFVNGQTDRMFSRTLSANLERLVERPWTEMRKGKPVTEAWLATQLRPYGVRPKTIWIGEHAAKGYLLADFNELFTRYIPPSEIEALRAASKKAGENIPSGGPASATSGNVEWRMQKEFF
jgi:hypothetical protein